jgi:glycosyltransferase involved in cell wall biosynthesis
MLTETSRLAASPETSPETRTVPALVGPAERALGTVPAILYAYPEIRWDMVPARQRYLMEAMSAHCRVVFLNGPSLDGRWIEARRPRAERLSERLTVVHDSFCFRFSRLGRKIRPLSAVLDGAWLRQVLTEQGVSDYLFWVAAAQPAVLPGMRYRHLIYDCIDPCFIDSMQPRFDRAEMYLARRASVVFCTAESLLERMRAVNAEAHLLPNACSLEEYVPHSARTIARPELLRGRPTPVIGYMGTVDWRLDTATLLAAARRLPQFTFAIVGRINNDRRADAAALRALPNVVMPGPVSLEEGRAYAAAFDVGIIPFLPGHIADAINPVKMYMYLAGGKPVVSTWCRECRNHEPLVRAARTPEEFASALVRAASENSPADVALRVEFARLNTWKDRADSAVAILRRLGIFGVPAPSVSSASR